MRYQYLTTMLKPSPVKGVDYPPDPEGTGRNSNLGVYGRFAYFPSLDVFVLLNDRGRDAWILRLTDRKLLCSQQSSRG